MESKHTDARGAKTPKRASWMTGLVDDATPAPASEPPGVTPMPKSPGFARARKIEGEPLPFSVPQNPVSLEAPASSRPSPVETSNSRTPVDNEQTCETASYESSLRKDPLPPVVPSQIVPREGSTVTRIKKAPSFLGADASVPSPFTAIAKIQTAIHLLSAEEILDRPEYEPYDVARSMLEYFARPLDGAVTEELQFKDGSVEHVSRPASLHLPSFQEFSRLLGLTPSELKELISTHPLTVGRAAEICKGILQDHIVRRSLSSKHDARFATFLADNVTDLRIKKQVEAKVYNVGDLLRQIEAADKPIRYDDESSL